MKVSSLVHVIQTLVEDSGQTSERHLAHAAEELGEVAKAAREARDAQRGQAHLKLEEAQVEAVDLAICAFALYASFGGSAEEFEHVFARKCSKWKLALENRSKS